LYYKTLDLSLPLYKRIDSNDQKYSGSASAAIRATSVKTLDDDHHAGQVGGGRERSGGKGEGELTLPLFFDNLNSLITVWTLLNLKKKEGKK